MKNIEAVQNESRKSQHEQYVEELQEQRDKLISENPQNAWMIETAYQLTRRPYKRCRGRRF